MRILSGVLLVFASFNILQAQSVSDQADSLSSYFQTDSTSNFGFLETYFPPIFIQNGMELKSFIRSDTFKKLRSHYGDLKAVDAIFIRAMKLTKNNTAMALLLATKACFDHRTVGLKVPVFALFFPLSNESRDEFKTRVANLPRRFYPDTPRGRSGDRDKLQHFFGSAFLAFTFESSGPAERTSEFVEKGEDLIIIDGTIDARDIRTNRQGQQFGLALLKNCYRLPSEFILPQIQLSVAPDSSNSKRTP